jgi:outer membrane protein assembly factor BamB
MAIQSSDTIHAKPVRLWPGVAAAVLMVLLRFVAPLVAAEGALIAIFGAVITGVAIVVWWTFFSRVPWPERLRVLVLMITAVFATRYIVHPSISGGMMGMMLPIYLAVPGVSFALVAAVFITRHATAATRRIAIVAAVVLACGLFTLLRTDGLKGGTAQLAWRWTPTAEDRLLAQARVEPVVPAASTPSPAPAPAPAPAVTTADPATRATPVAADRRATETPDAARGRAADRPVAASAGAAASGAAANTIEKAAATSAAVPVKMNVRWPGFRGPARDSVVHGARIATDWSASPPVQIWRQPIGPGWSSFAVADDVIYTQEQRGADEVVACYRLSTGTPVWMHKDPVRFYESNGGAGPRSTPTLSNGRVYTLGATGILNALDARTGAVVWTRNAVTDAAIKVPGWGIASSPAVVGDLIVVAVSGALAGYDVATGAPRWSRKSGGGSYSSPHLVTVDGVPQILLMAGGGITSVSPADGTLLWEHAWPGVPIVQPAQIAGGDFLVTTADGMGALGMRRIAVTHDAAGWKAEERWTSNGLKPYFNDYVVHKGHAYGFDGSILACIDLADGKRAWKGGRYGNGQFVLLPDQDVLLVLSEEGELALVSATPDRFTELARFKAIEGKTWNHPVLVDDVLIVRNGEEMAAFRLPLATR